MTKTENVDFQDVAVYLLDNHFYFLDMYNTIVLYYFYSIK
jgi:hypothetical protein